MTKILTDTLRVTTATATTQTAITSQIMVQETARQFALKHWIIGRETQALQTLNVQRLMTYRHALETFHLTQMLPLSERQQTISQILTVPQEEERLKTKRLLTRKQISEQKIIRRERTRLERWLQTVQERLLSPMAISLIDHTVLCRLDKLLIQAEPTIIPQILQQILEMCEKKTKHIPILVGQQALQKHLLQTYCTMFMNHPYGTNMLALRLSALTKGIFEQTYMTYYYQGAVQAQAVKQKSILISCEKRRMETKLLSKGKPLPAQIPMKMGIKPIGKGVLDEKVGTPKDIFGQEGVFMALRYMYSMPYWIRRMMAIHFGMPESHKYAGYFSIGGLPSRRSTLRYKMQKYPELKYITWHKDAYVRMLLRKYWVKRYGFYKRYAKFYPVMYERLFRPTRRRH